MIEALEKMLEQAAPGTKQPRKVHSRPKASVS